MTDKLQCHIFHAFDGHCCEPGEACPLVVAKREPAPPVKPSFWTDKRLFWLACAVPVILMSAILGAVS